MRNGTRWFRDGATTRRAAVYDTRRNRVRVSDYLSEVKIGLKSCSDSIRIYTECRCAQARLCSMFARNPTKLQSKLMAFNQRGTQ